MMTVRHLHEGWEFVEKAKEGEPQVEWMPAQVPGHVHLDLMENGVIADPYSRKQELGVQWVDETEWSYRTTFDWTPTDDLPKRVLRFEGLDTVCEIYLNGERIGKNANMLVPVEFDVSRTLQEGENELRIDFASASATGRRKRDWYFKKHGIHPNTAGFEERSFVRKAQCMYGWDWGPRLLGCGVWKPVKLLEYAGRIENLHVRQDHRGDGSVHVTIDTTLDGPAAKNADTRIVMAGPDGPIQPESPGHFVVKEPKLWWPNGYGEQPMYTIGIGLVGDGEVLDKQKMRVGLRRVELVRERDEHGESFTVECNGKEIWARGANWIPNDSFPGIVDTRDYREQVERCIDLGFNMVRIWGGGLIGDEQFMVAADEMGLLVWHDFPYACALYPDDDEYREEARKESRTMVRKLRNHTSLAFWCGNNENQMIFESGWSRAKVPPTRLFGENIYHEVIPEVLSEEDPDRSYIPSSPWGTDKNKDTPAHWGANAGGVGNQHNWDVWHGRGDWRHYAESTTRFSSEFGFSSSCSLAVWEEWLPPESWSPISPDVRWHDKTGKGTETYHDFIRLHYPDLDTLDDLVYYSQLNQRDALRFGIEHLRRSEFCKGSLVWQFNDCWPVQSWSMQDYSRCLKPLGFEMMRLYRHELISIVREKDQVQIWAVNDGLEPYTLQAQFFCSSTESGDVLKIDPLDAKVEPGERKVIHETSIRGVPMDEGLMSVLAGDELLAWQLLGEPKHGKFGPARIAASLNGGDGLTLRIEGPVVDLMVYDPDDPENVYSEADTKLRGPVMITSPFGGIYELHADRPPKELYARSLAGYHPVLISRGAF